MPIGSRVRANNVFGLVADNPLTAGSPTLNSSGLVNLPSISASQHAIIVLDPLRVNGAPEIVVVTAHGALSATATITRAQYGTVARSHPSGTMWMHTPVDEDYIEILTAATRPTNPYEGQFIYETDTNKLVGYDGVDWSPRDAGGQLGYAQVVANQGGITAEVDLTGMTVNVIVGTGRRVKISGWGFFNSSVTNDIVRFLIHEDGVQIASGGAILPVTFSVGTSVFAVRTPTAGAHTYKLRAARDSGTGSLSFNASAVFPAFILVEDIGAA